MKKVHLYEGNGRACCLWKVHPSSRHWVLIQPAAGISAQSCWPRLPTRLEPCCLYSDLATHYKSGNINTSTKFYSPRKEKSKIWPPGLLFLLKFIIKVPYINECLLYTVYSDPTKMII